MKLFILFVLIILLLFVLSLFVCVFCVVVLVYGYCVVYSYLYDISVYIEGLFYCDGFLYESIGNVGVLSICKVDFVIGQVLQQCELLLLDYGEGIVAWYNQLIELMW